MFFKTRYLILTILSITILESSSAEAQGVTRGRRRWTPAPYDTSTVQTVTGRVIAMERLATTRRRSRGIHAMLKSDGDTLLVYLAPRWHFKRVGFRIFKGDTVTVTGSKVILDGHVTLVAAEVRKGELTMKLREKDGSAAWWKGRQ